MATQDELDTENQASLKRQRQTREFNQARGALKDQRNEALQGATSTKERREIKEAYNGAVYDLSTNYNPRQNKTDYESDIGQRGVDQFTAPEATPEASGGGGLPDGYVETAFTLCVDGAPVGGSILFKAN